ncbi:MAG: thioredoxin [Ruminococcaceae bacterium]|nr:thioredoxin [Oscillospiraceae bacterium]
MATENIIYLTNETFDNIVKNSEKPVFVDFWADWCGPCRALAPIFERVALNEAYKDKIVFAKADVDKCEIVALNLRIASIPTLMLFKDGAIAEKLIGLRAEDEIKEILDQYI